MTPLVPALAWLALAAPQSGLINQIATRLGHDGPLVNISSLTGIAIVMAFTGGAVEALRLAADIARYAERLFAIAPKLRAKGAGEVIRKLLDEDAVPGTLTTKTLSRFGARRLFQRLQDVDAVRELSGRSAFRLYGL